MDLEQNGKKIKVTFDSWAEHQLVAPAMQPYMNAWAKWRLAVAGCIVEYPNQFSSVHVPEDSLPAILSRVEQGGGDRLATMAGCALHNNHEELDIVARASARIRQFIGEAA